MFFVILSVIALILLVVGIICSKIYYGDWPWVLAFISGAILFLFGLISICCYTGDNKDYAVFIQQKSYIENHICDNEIENAALTSKKIELNQWLIGAKYNNKHYALFNFIPNEIQNIDLIN